MMMFALLAAVSSSKLPPIGAVYERTLSLPVIGEQTLRLSILDSRRANISLAGALSLDEELRYGLDRRTGKLLFTLGAHAVTLLRRYRVGLNDAEYTGAGDEAYVTITPPLIPPIRIRLDRASEPEALARAPDDAT
jgi:hypothetical protein